MNTYSNRSVGFVDLLGFEDKIGEIAGDPSGAHLQFVQEVLENIKNLEEQTKSDFAKQYDTTGLKVSVFSDCLYCSAPEQFYLAPLLFTYRVVEAVLKQGFLCRGGITIGGAWHDDRIQFGQAMIRAYELEHREATYPRILLDHMIVDRIKTETTKWVESLYCQDDVDDWYYLNTFQGPITHILNPLIKHNGKEEAAAYWSVLHDCIANGITASRTKTKVLQKYYWAAKKYDKFKPNDMPTLTKAGSNQPI